MIPERPPELKYLDPLKNYDPKHFGHFILVFRLKNVFCVKMSGAGECKERFFSGGSFVHSRSFVLLFGENRKKERIPYFSRISFHKNQKICQWKFVNGTEPFFAKKKFFLINT